MFSAQARAIFQQIKGAKNILLITHQQPDGDALGAVTAVAELCTTLEKTFHIFCHTPASAQFNYLKHISILTHDPNVWQNPPWDLIIVCDSGDLHYAGVDTYIDHLDKKIPFQLARRLVV
jgi:nanoRNase/pAp phosphatase (c-di-AMP/oligoRNAs hydrolase)